MPMYRWNKGFMREFFGGEEHDRLIAYFGSRTRFPL
jgi:hypothetical protein